MSAVEQSNGTVEFTENIQQNFPVKLLTQTVVNESKHLTGVKADSN